MRRSSDHLQYFSAALRRPFSSLFIVYASFRVFTPRLSETFLWFYAKVCIFIKYFLCECLRLVPRATPHTLLHAPAMGDMVPHLRKYRKGNWLPLPFLPSSFFVAFLLCRWWWCDGVGNYDHNNNYRKSCGMPINGFISTCLRLFALVLSLQ